MFRLLICCVLVLKSLQNSYAQCTASPTTATGTHAPNGQICSGDLIFEDNFDNFDLDKWSHEQTLAGGGNKAFQWYTNNRENSYANNGNLYLKPTLLVDDPNNDGFLYSGSIDINDGECTDSSYDGCHRQGSPDHVINPVKSALVRTMFSFAFTYGRVEIRAKLPAGDWLWPAIWFMPRDSVYGNWPASGEIDLMESRGNRDYTNGNGGQIGCQQMGSTMHWGPDPGNNKYPLTHWDRNNGNGFDTDFHNYQLNWTPDGLSFAIDGDEVGSVYPPVGGFWELGNLGSTGQNNPWGNSKMGPFDQNFYIILNVAVGGTAYFPDNGNNAAGNKPWNNGASDPMTDFWRGHNDWVPTWQLDTDNAAMQIDYVRVWAI